MRAARSGRALLLALLPLAGVLASVPPASADRAEITDHVADVWRETYDDQGYHEGWEREPGRSLEDADSLLVRHTGRGVRIVVHMLDLRSEAFILGALVEIRLDDGRVLDARVAPTRSGRAGRTTVVDRATGRLAQCEQGEVREREDDEAETFTIVVSRTCLDGTRWVRVSAAVRGSDNGDIAYRDAIGVRGPGHARWTPRLRVG